MMGQRALLNTVLAVSALVAISAVLGIVAAFLPASTAWFFLGFEVVTLFAAAFGVLIGRGKFAEGVALGLLCVAGAILSAGLFGYLGAGRVLPIGSRQIGLGGLLAARLGAGLVLAGCAAWVVLGVRPAKSVPLLIKGVACGVPALALVWAAWSFRGKIAGMGLSQVVLALGGAVVGAVVIGLLAAAVHLAIKAFAVSEESPANAK